MNPADTLLTPELVSTLGGLELQARTVAESVLAGRHHSRRKGYTSRFTEHRDYSPGDDLRHIDWKIFGKRDRFYIRQFEDETKLRLWFVLDVSPSMNYRSAEVPFSKLHFAAILAAATSWIAHQQQDELGLLCCDGSTTNMLIRSEQFLQGEGMPFQRLIAQLETLILTIPSRDQLSQSRTGELSAGKVQLSPLGKTLGQWSQQLTSRCVVVWLTDGLGDEQELQRLLNILRFHQHDVRLMHIVDPAEATFAFDSPTLFHGLEGEPDLFLSPQSIRSAYLTEWQAFVKRLEQSTRNIGCGYQRMRTDEPLDLQLREWFHAE